VNRHAVLSVLVAIAFAQHMFWWSGNVYEAIVVAPPQLASWRQGRAPGMRIDPRWYYLPAAPVGLLCEGTAFGLALADSYHLAGWLAIAVAASALATGLTVYLVRAVNLPLFYADPAPTPAVGLPLMRRWVGFNLVRVALVAVAVAAMFRVLWDLAR
jgi:hypothetical protein